MSRGPHASHPPHILSEAARLTGSRPVTRVQAAAPHAEPSLQQGRREQAKPSARPERDLPGGRGDGTAQSPAPGSPTWRALRHSGLCRRPGPPECWLPALTSAPEEQENTAVLPGTAAPGPVTRALPGAQVPLDPEWSVRTGASAFPGKGPVCHFPPSHDPEQGKWGRSQRWLFQKQEGQQRRGIKVRPGGKRGRGSCAGPQSRRKGFAGARRRLCGTKCRSRRQAPTCCRQAPAVSPTALQMARGHRC